MILCPLAAFRWDISFKNIKNIVQLHIIIQRLTRLSKISTMSSLLIKRLILPKKFILKCSFAKQVDTKIEMVVEDSPVHEDFSSFSSSQVLKFSRPHHAVLDGFHQHSITNFIAKCFSDLQNCLKLEQLKTVLGWRRRLTVLRCRVPCLLFASGTSIQGRQILLQHERGN